MKHVFVALAVVTASAVAGVSVASTGAPVAGSGSTAHSGAPLQVLDGLQDTIERIDRFLESVIDLIRTIQKLLGGEGGE